MDESQLSRLNAVYSRWSTRTSQTPGKSDVIAENHAPGQLVWQQHFDGEEQRASRPHQTRGRRHRRQKVKKSVAEVLPITFTITLPLVTPQSRVQRPFLGRCCETCTPISRSQLFDKHISAAPLQDMLQMAYVARPNLVRRLFPHLSFCLSRDVPWQHPSVEREVLNSDRVQTVVQEVAVSGSSSLSDYDKKQKLRLQQQRAVSILETMASSISGLVVRLTATALFKVFGSATSGIRVHQGQMEMVKHAARRGIPIVYLPVHKSHFDYHILTYTAFCHDLKTPHVAAGDNLSTWGLSQLLRRLGGFFIKRKLEDETGQRDPVYNAVLQEYITCLLKHGEHIEFFLEGRRSRSGKIMEPKCGLLSMVVDAVVDDVIPDVYIVPVSFGYDKIAEQGFGDELLGRQKKKESFTAAIRSVWRLVTGNYGTVQVNMAQPFSLQEFIEGCPGCESNVSVRRNLVSRLAKHILHTADHSFPVMSTAMVAFLLLNKYREGVSYSKLVAGFSRLQQEISSRERDVGFGVNVSTAVSNACQLLKPYLIEENALSSETNNKVMDTERTVKANLTLPTIFELAYYSNQVLSVFLLEAVVATAIRGLCGAWLTTEAACGISNNTIVSQDELLMKAEELCSLFDHEFIFNPPCVTLRSVLYDGLEALIAGGMMSCTQSQPTRRTAYWDDEDDMEYSTDRSLKLHALVGQLQKLSFFHSLLAPFVESYWMVAHCLSKLRDQPMTQTQFLSEVQDTIKQRLNDDLCHYAESCSSDPLSNAIKHFLRRGVIERSEVSVDYLILSETHTSDVTKLSDLWKPNNYSMDVRTTTMQTPSITASTLSL